MSELAIPAAAGADLAVPAAPTSLPRAAVALVEWAKAAEAAHELAGALVRTSFCPAQFRGKPGEATAAILAGSEVGLSPMAALRGFDIIEGTAAPKALTLRAVVQSLGHELIITEQSPTRARGKGRRRDSQEWQYAEWTIDRARKLGLVDRKTKSGRPNQWTTQPSAMLVARVTGELARWVAADAILGIGYSAEEQADEAAATLVSVAPPTRVRRPTKPARPVDDDDRPVEDVPLPEPEFDEPVDADPDDGSGDPITPPQSRLLHKLLRDRYGDDRDAWLTDISERVARPVDTTNDLTVAEASLVIGALDPGPEEDQ